MDLDSTVSPVYGNQEGADKEYNPKKRGLKSYHPLLAIVYEKGFLTELDIEMWEQLYVEWSDSAFSGRRYAA